MPGRAYNEELAEGPPQPIVLPWDNGTADSFKGMFAQAHQTGEHVAIVGPNGSGKTLLGLELCKIVGDRRQKNGRPWPVTVLQYKPKDSTLSVIGDWPVIKKWPPRYGEEHCIVWPRGGSASGAATRQRAVFAPLLDKIYNEHNQAVFIPEAAYFERAQPNGLGLSGTMEQFWGTARSLDITVISDTQRPRRVTILMWTEPAWLIIFKLESWDDIKHVAGLSGNPMAVTTIVPQLGEHEFLCLRRQRHAGAREIYVSRVEVVTRNIRNKAA